MKSIIATLFLGISGVLGGNHTHIAVPNVSNNCIQFSVSTGTGCAWMCTYCSNQLATYNYYFPDGVCTYEGGGCVGNPIAGKQYTCCSV